jgi:hypothetical protein
MSVAHFVGLDMSEDMYQPPQALYRAPSLPCKPPMFHLFILPSTEALVTTDLFTVSIISSLPRFHELELYSMAPFQIGFFYLEGEI